MFQFLILGDKKKKKKKRNKEQVKTLTVIDV